MVLGNVIQIGAVGTTASITATAATGSVVTCTTPTGIVLSATESSGTWYFGGLTIYGRYTITGTLSSTSITAYVDVDAMTDYSVLLSNRTYLYNGPDSGNECTALTGGWESEFTAPRWEASFDPGTLTTVTQTKGTDHLLISAGSSDSFKVYPFNTASLVSFSGFSTLYIQFTVTALLYVNYLQLVFNKYGNYANGCNPSTSYMLGSMSVLVGTNTASFAIPSGVSSAYIVIYSFKGGASDTTGSEKITAVWLE